MLVSEGDDAYIGTAGGEEKHALTAEEMPQHRHAIQASTNPAAKAEPDGVLGSAWLYSTDPLMDVKLATSTAGSNAAHDNMQPYLTLRCIIAVQGWVPARD